MNKYRYSFDDIQAAAQGQWHFILTSVGIPAHSLTNKHQPCPMCGGKNRYRFDDKNGTGSYFCNGCGAGNGFQFVQRFLSLAKFAHAVKVVAQLLGMGDTANPMPTPPKREFTPPPPPKDEINRIMRVWNMGTPIHNTLGESYLRKRGISRIPETSELRYCSQLSYWHKDDKGEFHNLGKYGALIGLMRDTQGEVTGLQRIYLQGDQKAQILDPETGERLDCKKQMTRWQGRTTGTAIHIMPIDETGFLCVAEGIETALAAHELFNGVSVWATVNAGNMARLHLPQGLKRLLIVADNDPTGRHAAHDLAVRAIKQGIKTQIWQPESTVKGFDALDELNKRKQAANTAKS